MKQISQGLLYKDRYIHINMDIIGKYTSIISGEKDIIKDEIKWGHYYCDNIKELVDISKKIIDSMV